MTVAATTAPSSRHAARAAASGGPATSTGAAAAVQPIAPATVVTERVQREYDVEAAWQHAEDMCVFGAESGNPQLLQGGINLLKQLTTKTNSRE